MYRRHALLAILAAFAVAAAQAVIRSQSVSLVTTPLQQFGANIGDDYFLATYSQLERYWQTLDRESDRLALVDIGRTEEGRTQWMAVVTAPENHARLARYQDISRRLARAEGLTEAQARALADEGKAIVWIDGGLHADEVLGAQQLIELVYQLVSGSDAETLRILRDVIVLVGHANPDGHELVATWYMREADPVRRRLSGIPRTYQKYVGHDNNRDFYLSSQAETTNINRVLYKEWLPQIVFDHHQSGPPGTVMFAPPFRDPFNYVFDPIVPASIDLIGAAMHARFAEEGKPGVTMRGGSTYSTWWNGGLRTTAYFHNQIGLLTETIGDPTPISIPFVADRQVPSGDLPFPIPPQRWRFRQSIDYSMTANRAVLDTASRYRETLLLNFFRMGRNAIERGRRDTWTLSPKRMGPDGHGGRDPMLRDARAYVLPSDQPDFLTAAKFVETLLKTGVTVHRAASVFQAGGKSYPAGSYVVLTAQAFRPHILDMFEPQDHPDDIPYPGATPVPPYDIAGWTLAFQMGVKFDRVLEAVDGRFEVVTAASVPPGRVVAAEGTAGFLFSHHQNDAFIAVNRLLRAGAHVYWLTDRAAGGAASGTGMMYVEAANASADAQGRLEVVLDGLANAKGLVFTGVAGRPASATLRLRPVRIGLWDQYGGSSTSGWTRWLLEQYEFPYETVYAPAIDAGALADRFEVLILPDDAVPGSAAAASAHGGEDGRAGAVPPEYRDKVGRLTWAHSEPRLKAFADGGGTLIAIGDATVLGEHLGIIRNALVDAHDRTSRPLTRQEHYVPGSVLRVAVDNRAPLGYGFEETVDVFFDDSPAFRLPSDSVAQGARRVAWYSTSTPLRSGWALGQRYLEGALAAVDAPVGRGRLFLFGPEITFRGQPHGTFKFLFNAIYAGHLVTSPGARPNSPTAVNGDVPQMR
jgi:hypothetical protein